MQAEYILLADSQPLFHSDRLAQFLRQVIHQKKLRSGIYIGAANQNEPAFYELASAAFERFSIKNHHHLQSADEQALTITDQPAVVILAGGELQPGWQYLSQQRVYQWLVAQRQLGGLFIGISAGAVHLTSGLNHSGQHQHYLGWMNMATAVHEEADQWPSIAALQQTGAEKIAGIPYTDGIIFDGKALTSLLGNAFLCSPDDSISTAKKLRIYAHR